MPEKNKAQAIRALNNATHHFTNAVDSCKAIQEMADLPKAFPVVSKHLPVLSQTLESMLRYVESSEETQEARDKYTDVYNFAETCRETADYLQDIFGAVATAKDSTQKLERYRNAVDEADGTKLESAMLTLLEKAVGMAAVPLVGADLVEQLEGARKEVASLRPSLKEDSKGVVMVNKDKGYQFLHTGAGNQHNCSGGIQISGPGANNHFGQDMKVEAGKGK